MQYTAKMFDEVRWYDDPKVKWPVTRLCRATVDANVTHSEPLIWLFPALELCYLVFNIANKQKCDFNSQNICIID